MLYYPILVSPSLESEGTQILMQMQKPKVMTTHFITAEIDLQETPIKLQKAIERELEKQGKPLRWAITEVNTESKTAKVEAIVTHFQSN